MTVKAPTATVLRFGIFELDLDAGELRRAGVRIRVQKQPLQILSALLENPGEVVSRDRLRSELWSEDTFVDFDNSLNTSINKLRDALGDTSSSPRFIETIPRRGYRFIAPVITNGHQESLPRTPERLRTTDWKIPAIAFFVLFSLVAGLIWLHHPRFPLEKGTVVVGEFANRTGDPVFDATLKQGLSVQLEQSPQLRVLPVEQVRNTLRMMDRPEDIELSAEVTQEVCQRNNASAALDGAIAFVGTKYELVLRAVACNNGDLLASAEAQSSDKDHVLDAVTKLASDMREKLGESLSSVRQYNVPLESATTPSLAALRCYTQGLQVEMKNFDYKSGVSWFKKAIELDPHFAMAYFMLGDAYGDTGESGIAKVYTRKAFELRENVSQREKWLIEGSYYYYVLGDLTKARRSFELMARLYPDSQYAHNSVAAIVESLGDFQTGLGEYQQALNLPPRTSYLYRDVADTYLILDRIEAAMAEVREAHAAGLDTNLASVAYSIAFYRGDSAEMARQVAAAADKPGIEDLVLALDADTAAYFGKLETARLLSTRAAESADRAGQKESSAQYYAASAIREGLFQNTIRARQQAAIAKKYSGGRDLDYGIALAVTYSGDLKQADKLTTLIANKYPEDTIVQCNYLPTLRARLALVRLKPQEAVDALVAGAPCDLNLPAYSYYNWPNLYPIYVRGEAYLAVGRGAEAVVEFQKILSHRGLVLNEPIGVLAHLQLGRAYCLLGNATKGAESYQNFLSLWKEADPNIPILKRAKAEYTVLTGKSPELAARLFHAEVI